MSAHGVLDLVLKDILKVIIPLQEDWTIRFKIIDDLRRVVESVENLRGATVEPFGSFVSNLFTRWGDLDISIELANRSYISSAGKKHKQMLLGDLLKSLKMKGGWSSLQFISNARVPILKLKSNHQGISCDISIDNLQGQMKSKLLFWISNIDNRFHDMVLLVKEWAKAHKINNSKTGTLNSYSLSLLVIFHLQTCGPAILPPLKDIYPGNMVDDLRGVRADAEKLIAETCGANITRFKSKFRPINKRSVCELFLEFLRKVEDPFEQPQNTARSVSAGQLTKIAEAFRSTHGNLRSNNLTRSSILVELARPQVSRFVMGHNPGYGGGQYYPTQSPCNPGYSGGHYSPTQPRVQRAMRPPSQTQHRYQNVNQAKGPNNSTTRGPVQAHKAPQIWRQKSK